MTSTNGSKSAQGRALDHIKVLDLTIARAGPSAVRVLSDLGADVVQVIRPGESAVGIDASLPDFDRENLHRSKRSVSIDLQKEEGRAVFYRLAKDADVVVENFRADVKYRLGVDYETLKGVNPRIILGSISGFGQEGPYSKRPGVDQIAQGMGGLMSITGPPGSGPWRVGIAVGDLVAGLYLAHGIMAAIIEREKSGIGQWVQTSLLETIVGLLDFQATRWLIAGEVAGQAGNDHPTSFPTGLFPTKDGVVNLAAAGERMFGAFIKGIGAEHLAEDPRFSSTRARTENREELREIVSGYTRQKTTQEWVDHFAEVGVPCGPVNSIDQVFADPQVQFLGMAQDVPNKRHGSLPLIRSPIGLSRTPASMRGGYPGAGANTRDVLLEHGFSESEISGLLASGVIQGG
jgi:formyl-CoA transferase